MKNYLLLIFLFCSLVSSAQYINRYAGSESVGYNGENIPALSAYLNLPIGLAVDKIGNLYIADSRNNRIRKVDTFGIITTIAGTGVVGLSGDGGLAIDAKMDYPSAIYVDTNMEIYFSEGNRIRKIDNNGIISTFAGTTMGYSGDGGPATLAALFGPMDITFDHLGNLYIADVGNSVVRMVDKSGLIYTVAGNGIFGHSGNGGPATNAKIAPYNLVIDKYNNLYVSEEFNHRIRKIDTSGVISDFAGSGPIDTGAFGGDAGPATNARLDFPGGMDFDNFGNLYFVDQYNHRIRKIDTNGMINTFAGSGPVGIGAGGSGGDRGLAISAGFDHPCNLKVKDSTIFVIDYGDNVIRRIDNSLWVPSYLPYLVPSISDSISIYPNPITSSRILHIDQPNHNGKYVFYSTTGVIMQSGTTPTDHNLKIELPPGNYVLKLTNAITGNPELKIITVL